MTRYIDADTLYVNVKAECNPYGKPTIDFNDGCKVLDMIRRTPTADVAPVVHAHWEEHYGDDKCTSCGFVCGDSFYLGSASFCPNCGAKMDEEV